MSNYDCKTHGIQREHTRTYNSPDMHTLHQSHLYLKHDTCEMFYTLWVVPPAISTVGNCKKESEKIKTLKKKMWKINTIKQNKYKIKTTSSSLCTYVHIYIHLYVCMYSWFYLHRAIPPSYFKWILYIWRFLKKMFFFS